MRSGPTFNFRQRQNFFSNYFNGFCCKTIFSLSILTACCGQAIFSRICAYSHILYALDFLLLLLRKIFSQILWKIGSCHNFDTIPSHIEKKNISNSDFDLKIWFTTVYECGFMNSWKTPQNNFYRQKFQCRKSPAKFFYSNKFLMQFFLKLFLNPYSIWCTELLGHNVHT